MKRGQRLLAILLIASGAARAQVVPPAAGSPTAPGPAATSPAEAGAFGLPVAGTLRYGLHYSEGTGFSNGQGGQQSSTITGDASYANTNPRLPFSVQYGGGYQWGWNGATAAGNVFQHLSFSQGIVWRAWQLSGSESVSYSFETPTTGFSGVPGSGEPIGGPAPTPTPDVTILSQNTRSVDNFTTISIGHRLNYATSLNIGGSWGQMLFIGDNGQNSDTLGANAGLTRRLNARNSVSGQYSYSRFNFGGVNSASQANSPQISYTQASSAQFGFSRQWNGKISTSASFGPQWLSTSNSTLGPSSTNVAAGASASDAFKFGAVSVNYSHGATSGSGYMTGAESDIVSGSFSRKFGKNLDLGLAGSYMHTAALNSKTATNGCFGGAQASRPLGRYFSIFANYTAMDQSSNLPKADNVLSNPSQSFSFGIGYSPREIRLNK